MASKPYTDDAVDSLEFVFTGGDLSGRRSDWIELIESNGGTVAGAISEETDYLVVNPSADLGRVKVASDLGLPTIQERGLAVFLKNRGAEWQDTTE
ncbi:BRCT domain-containing protein [Halorussus halophilus]|uniref:BRCT domain-containing protein n=1 Tax=Halorussus halophilus TaxID=2650975 RepID=UPI00130117E5|nr:BRCT domain-containing protein [Halorussus halophilus]